MLSRGTATTLTGVRAALGCKLGMMAWRITLLVGVTVAVLLYGVSVWAYGQEQTLGTTECVYGPTADGGCAKAPSSSGGSIYADGPSTEGSPVTLSPHHDLALYTRYAAGATIIVTLAALPLLGLGRRSGRAQPDAAEPVD